MKALTLATPLAILLTLPFQAEAAPVADTSSPSTTSFNSSSPTPTTAPECACHPFGECFLRENDDGSYSLSSPRGSYRVFRDPDKNRVEGVLLKGDLAFDIELEKIYWKKSEWTANSNVSVYDKKSYKGLNIHIHKPLDKYGVTPDKMDFTLSVSGKDPKVFKNVFTTDKEHKLEIKWSHPIVSISYTTQEPTTLHSTTLQPTTPAISNEVKIILDGKTIDSFVVDFTFDTYDLSVSGLDMNYKFDIGGLGHTPKVEVEVEVEVDSE